MNGEQRLSTCCPSCSVPALFASLATVANDPQQLLLYVVCQESHGGCGIEYSFMERLLAPKVAS
jgi:hypothetical protein